MIRDTLMIKNKTYRNFLRIMKKIEEKGYDKQEAEQITHRLFNNFNPQGKPIEVMADEILPKQ